MFFYTANELDNAFLAIANFITDVAVAITSTATVALGIVRYRCSAALTLTLPDPVAMSAKQRKRYLPIVQNTGTGTVTINVDNGRLIKYPDAPAGAASVTLTSQFTQFRLTVDPTDDTNYIITTASTP